MSPHVHGSQVTFTCLQLSLTCLHKPACLQLSLDLPPIAFRVSAFIRHRSLLARHQMTQPTSSVLTALPSGALTSAIHRFVFVPFRLSFLSLPLHPSFDESRTGVEVACFTAPSAPHRRQTASTLNGLVPSNGPAPFCGPWPAARLSILANLLVSGTLLLLPLSSPTPLFGFQLACLRCV